MPSASQPLSLFEVVNRLLISSVDKPNRGVVV